jgi:alanine dehydrogenase
LSTAANVLAGQVTHPAVADAFGLDYRAPDDVGL